MLPTLISSDVEVQPAHHACSSPEQLWVSSITCRTLLHVTSDGHIEWKRDDSGNILTSPRSLRELCLHYISHDGGALHHISNRTVPKGFFCHLIAEAIFSKEMYAISYLVSIWPLRVLRVADIIPPEDDITSDYLTCQLEANNHLSLLDCLIIGMLNLRPCSKLRIVDFHGFEKDRKLCKELFRLPILWMRPEERTVEIIHDRLQPDIHIAKDKVQRYLNRISVVYCNMDNEWSHGTSLGPIIIEVDLNINLDDVPIGLVLQRYTPFRFRFSSVTAELIPDVKLPLANLKRILQTQHLSHVEFRYPVNTLGDVADLVAGVRQLRRVTTLSLHLAVDNSRLEHMVSQLAPALAGLPALRSLSLASTNLCEFLPVLLQPLPQPLVALNLADCRLMQVDLDFLCSGWPALDGLRELNLSRNNLRLLTNQVVSILTRTRGLVTFAASYCMLSTPALRRLALACRECRASLEVLCLQSFTPPPSDDMLDIFHACSQLPALRVCKLLPDGLYAFPGNNDVERHLSRSRFSEICDQLLAQLGRSDITSN